MSQGWISVHRSTKDWEWYSDSKLVHLFLHCLMSANHKPKQWRGIQIDAGQFITSRDKLASELPLSVQQVRTALDKLKSTGEITIKTTTKYSMISITNWSKYQESNQPISQQVTIKQPTSNQQVTTNNNDNNDNNVNNDNKKPKAKKVAPSKINKPDNVEEEVWQDWLTLRKTKRAPVSNTAINGAIKESEKAGISLNKFLSIWCTRGSQGLQASWLTPEETQTKQIGIHNGNQQKDTRSRAQKVSDELDEIARKDIEANGFAQTLD